MIELSVTDIAKATGATLYAAADAEGRIVKDMSWDSRKVVPGTLFVAMPGERVDGNDFIASAMAAGASAVLCTREPDDAAQAVAGEFACPMLLVEDATEALSKVAGLWRDKLHAVVIGVTGSCGKTSTKDFLKSVLSQRFKTAATVANHNNELGVPATVLSADADTEVLIVELGMRGLGQIERLCTFVKPSMGVITNIGVSHMELLGSQDAIADAKSELLQALDATGMAVLNADDPYTPYLKDKARIGDGGASFISYGFAPEAEVRAEDLDFDDAACARFKLCVPGAEPVPVRLPLPGRHNVSNALAAAAAGHYLGLTAQEIAVGLSSAQGSGMRMEVVRTQGGLTVVNDAYNANPDSMRASLATLSGMECAGRRIAALGDMGELGADELQMHADVGSVAAQSRLDLLVCAGTLGNEIARGAIAAGMDAGAVKCFADAEEALGFIEGFVQEGDVLLVKASRFMGMERIVEGVVG